MNEIGRHATRAGHSTGRLYTSSLGTWAAWMVLMSLVPLLSSEPAKAASYTAVAVTTSWPSDSTVPTHASLTGKVVNAIGNNVDVRIKMTALTGTYRLGCYLGSTGGWTTVGSAINADASFTGGVVYERFTPGSGCKAFIVYQEALVGTLDSIKIGVDITR